MKEVFEVKIAVLGAHGKAGSLIAEEAIKRGHQVTAFVRKKHDDRFPDTVEKDIMDIEKEDLSGFDAVINAVRAWTPETFAVHTDGVARILQFLNGTETKFLMMGGAGTLYVKPDHSIMVKDQPDYPDELKPLAAVRAANL